MTKAAAASSLQPLFPSLIYNAPLLSRGVSVLNAELLSELTQIRDQDEDGLAWSAQKYPGGYTSYASLDQLHQMTSTLIHWREKIDQAVAEFAREQHWDLSGGRLVMTDCWMNFMGPLCVHSGHIHPHSVVSGTYYVETPKGCSGLRFEDPKLSMYMNSPLRKSNAPKPLQHFVTLPAKAGRVTLFESWLRHEVPPSTVEGERVSLSFNYSVVD